MKKILTTLLFLILSSSIALSQLIDNKLNLYFGAGISISKGKKDLNENGFITPSLFNNFKAGFNFNIQATYKLIPYLSIGAQLKNISFSKWDYGNSSVLYKNSKSNIQSIGLGFIVHPKFINTGIFDKLSASIMFVPTCNLVKVKLNQAVFEIQPEELQSDLLNSENTTFGTDINFNIEYFINQKYAVFAESGVSYIPLKSQLYNDKKLLLFNANIGFCFKLMKDKHFNYH